MGWEGLSRGPRGSELEPPLVLFGRARRHGLVEELERSCRRQGFVDWEVFGAPGRLFMNTVPATIRDTSFLGRGVLDYLGPRLSPRLVTLEITERQVIENLNLYRDAMHAFLDLGFSFAIDDVGAGYSGLETMATLRPSYLKIDMSLVRDVHQKKVSQQVVKAILDMGGGHRRHRDRRRHPDPGRGGRGARPGRALRPGLPLRPAGGPVCVSPAEGSARNLRGAMKAAMVGLTAVLAGAVAAAPQSLGDVAEKEKKKREAKPSASAPAAKKVFTGKTWRASRPREDRRSKLYPSPRQRPRTLAVSPWTNRRPGRRRSGTGARASGSPMPSFGRPRAGCSKRSGTATCSAPVPRHMRMPEPGAASPSGWTHS